MSVFKYIKNLSQTEVHAKKYICMYLHFASLEQQCNILLKFHASCYTVVLGCDIVVKTTWLFSEVEV